MLPLSRAKTFLQNIPGSGNVGTSGSQHHDVINRRTGHKMSRLGERRPSVSHTECVRSVACKHGGSTSARTRPSLRRKSLRRMSVSRMNDNAGERTGRTSEPPCDTIETKSSTRWISFYLFLPERFHTPDRHPPYRRSRPGAYPSAHKTRLTRLAGGRRRGPACLTGGARRPVCADHDRAAW